MEDHASRARRHIDTALGEGPTIEADAWQHLAAAGIHSILAVADAIKHGLRDIVYELRD